MKILHVITSLDKGGAENHLTILAKEQKKRGNDVSIFISKNSNYWLNSFKTSKIKVFKTKFFIEDNIINKSKKLLSDVDNLIDLINNIKPQILHAHLPYMEIISYLSIFFSKHKPKFIITKHVDSDFLKGSITQSRTFFGVLLTRILSSKANKIIVISRAVKKYFLHKDFKIKSNKLKHIYYGLDNLKLFSKKEMLPIKIKIDKNTLVLGCIARLVPQKSIENILISLSYLKNINLKLILVGKGPLKSKLKSMSKELKIDKRIVWINFIDNTDKFYKSIDVFVLTSLYEGLGMVFLEAMLSKKPIISSSSSAMKEIIRNNYNGLLVKPNNPYQLSQAIIKLRDKKLRTKLGNSGYKFVKRNFSIDQMYNNTQKVYLDI